ncbi:hypothetical protein CBM2606_A180048 [Cupriavidus taiwanensis]|nr:hypothetical protein CBM2606_A180048 [Cupriavidus taiwanensis]
MAEPGCGQICPSLGITGRTSCVAPGDALWDVYGQLAGGATDVYAAADLSRQIRVIPEPLSLLQVTDPEGKR